MFLTETVNQDLVSINWTLIAQICNLFIQVLLIKKFLFKPVREILAKRQAKADADIREAAEAKEAAAAIKSEYEQNMLEAKEKANELLAAAQKNAAEKSDQMIKDASAQAAAIKQKAESDIAQERRKAVNELKDEIGDMAMEIAGKVIEREISEKDHQKLIDEFISNV
ncbi:MAG: F0F1 ATP synthase subunit B [Lachnospiraceae bacterium]|nr:F0F1 ATP synthase subunit B [Lachnospiraceae bacterium]